MPAERDSRDDRLHAERPARQPLRHLLPGALRRRVNPFKPAVGDAHVMRANNQAGDEPATNDSWSAVTSGVLFLLVAGFVAWILYMVFG